MRQNSVQPQKWRESVRCGLVVRVMVRGFWWRQRAHVSRGRFVFLLRGIRPCRRHVSWSEGFGDASVPTSVVGGLFFV